MQDRISLLLKFLWIISLRPEAQRQAFQPWPLGASRPEVTLGQRERQDRKPVCSGLRSAAAAAPQRTPPPTERRSLP